MSALRRMRGSLLAAASLALTAALLAAPPASGAAPSYVALGDSYSSGTGTRSYIADGTSCQRSTYAYPSLIAAARGYALNFRACSGARIADVTNTQLGALSAGTAYVTISVGGNDAGFADVITECALPWWAADCDGAIDGAQAFINNQLPGQLSTLYAAIRTRAMPPSITWSSACGSGSRTIPWSGRRRTRCRFRRRPRGRISTPRGRSTAASPRSRASSRCASRSRTARIHPTGGRRKP